MGHFPLGGFGAIDDTGAAIMGLLPETVTVVVRRERVDATETGEETEGRGVATLTMEVP